jgi:hypothetical protein
MYYPLSLNGYSKIINAVKRQRNLGLVQGTPAMPMPMGNEQFQPPSSNLNANNSKKIKIENDHSQNITPQQPNLQHVQGSPMPMNNLNSHKIIQMP